MQETKQEVTKVVSPVKIRQIYKCIKFPKNKKITPRVSLNFDEARHRYSKCPKILHTKVANKMAYANSADPDQTAPEGAV